MPQVVPAYERFERFQERVGERGLAVCLGCLRESGIRFMNMELMKYEQAVYDQLDYPDEFMQLQQTLDGFLDRLFDVAIDSPAVLINVGAHFDATLTPPPFFKQYTLPRLKKFSSLIHDKGKFMASHTDSENSGLLRYYIDGGNGRCGFCVYKASYLPYIQGYKTHHRPQSYFIRSHVPSIATLENSVSDYEFDSFIDELLGQIQDDGARNIILAIADTTPPDAKFERVERIAKLARQVKT